MLRHFKREQSWQSESVTPKRKSQDKTCRRFGAKYSELCNIKQFCNKDRDISHNICTDASFIG